MARRYRPSEHWSRLHERGDLSAVGQSGLPDAMNRWLYRSLERNVDRFLASHGVVVPDRVFDVGSGTGVWVDHWLRRGARRVDGCDVVPAAVARLVARYGGTGGFVEADIAAVAPVPDRYPLVSCMNVLLHLIDDEAFARGLRNVAALVAAGGWLLLAEPLAVDARAAAAASDGTSLARSARAYREGLERAGLRLRALGGASAFGNNPIEGGPAAPLWRAWWTGLVATSRLHPWNARWLGPLVYALDAIAVPRGAAPSGKIALFSRPA